MRVAFLSPLPPEGSGIADYAAELVPALAEHVELDLYTAHPRQAPADLARRFPIFPYRAFPARRRSGRYGAVLYQLGNSPAFHRQIYDAALSLPGVTVLHEFLLHHLVKELALARGGLAAFVEEMRFAYGADGEAAARGVISPDPWAWPLFERVVDASRALIVHSETARRRILASRPTARIALVPHHLFLGPLAGLAAAERRAVRHRLGVDDGELLVASFGYVTPAKRTEVALRAFRRLRARFPRARYAVVGEVSRGYPEMLALLGSELGERVTVTGRLPLADLLAWMAAADVAVNLRHPSGGETSGTCVRLLGLGTPVVVTDAGWFSEIPDGGCAKVPLGPLEEDLLTATLEALAASADLRRDLGRTAAAWAREHHALAVSARAYATFLTEVAATAPDPTPPVPPLAPTRPTDAAALLAAELGAAAAELGVPEDDEVLLPELAAALEGLGLGPG